jgi:hypothetical protein
MTAGLLWSRYGNGRNCPKASDLRYRHRCDRCGGSVHSRSQNCGVSLERCLSTLDYWRWGTLPRVGRTATVHSGRRFVLCVSGLGVSGQRDRYSAAFAECGAVLDGVGGEHPYLCFFCLSHVFLLYLLMCLVTFYLGARAVPALADSAKSRCPSTSVWLSFADRPLPVLNRFVRAEVG